jgi:hypothetical protein
MDTAPVVVARATFKTPDVLDNLDLIGEEHDPDAINTIVEQYVRHGETIRVEFLSDGSARVVPL